MGLCWRLIDSSGDDKVDVGEVVDDDDDEVYM